MEFDSTFSAIGIPLKVFLVDLLLSGDNAVLIALACRSLPAQVMRRAVLYGTGAAIALRFILATMVGVLLMVPWLKLIGAVALLAIAIKLIVGEDEAEGGETEASDELWAAIKTIIVADVVMSLDNVIGIAAVAQGSWGYIALGLLISVPLLVYGSMFVGRLMEQHPALITAGGALLAWIAGDLAVGDPVISGWVDNQAFALRVAVPIAAVIFALVHSRIIAEQRRTIPAPRRPSAKAGGGFSIIRFLADEFRPAPSPEKAPRAPTPAAPPKPVQNSGEQGKSSGSRILVIFFLIAAPLLFLGLMAFWVWSSTLSGY
jgi:YjbE family integral membrane protein